MCSKLIRRLMIVSLASFVAVLGITGTSGCKRRSTTSENREQTRDQSHELARDRVGVSSCDDYADKYEKCVDAMGPEEREQAAPSMKTQREAFKWWDKSPEAQGVLAEQCAIALKALERSCAR